MKLVTAVHPKCARTVFFGLVLFSSRVARAEPEELRFHLSYTTDVDTCPNPPAFLGAIHARTDRARLAASGESAPTFTVEITRPAQESAPEGSVLGRLEIREPDGTRQERAVEGQTCPEVATALALVVALYLDPDAEGAGGLPAHRPEGPVFPPSMRAPPSPPPAVRIGVGGTAGGIGGIGPAIAPIAGVFAEVAIARWLQPSARLSIDAATASADEAFGSQRYVLLVGALRACPMDVALVGALHLAPCAGIQAGLHRGASGGVPEASIQNKPWLAPTATASLGWDWSDAVTLEVEGGIVLPLQRARFFLTRAAHEPGPDLTLFRTPFVSGVVRMALRVRFR